MQNGGRQAIPVVFVGHGNPLNAISKNRYTDAWHALGRDLPRPRAILAISAHWFVPCTRVTVNEQPPTIHDLNRGRLKETAESELCPDLGSPAIHDHGDLRPRPLEEFSDLPLAKPARR